MVYNKSSFILWTLQRTFTSTLLLLGGQYSIDVITSS